MEEVNEDCGCGGTTDNIRSFNTNSTPKYSQEIKQSYFAY